MKILVISPVVPEPPSDGDKIRLYNIIKRLSKKHEIYLIGFKRPNEAGAAQVKKYCAKILEIKITRSEIIGNAVKGIFSGTPLNVAAFKSKKMEQSVDVFAEKYAPDAAFVYRLRMAQYAKNLKCGKVLDLVDALSLFMKRRLKFERTPVGFLYALIDSIRLQKYQKNICKKFDKVFINSKEDADYLESGNIVVVPNGVGREVKSEKGKVRSKRKKDMFVVGFFGGMKYPPNIDAIKRYYKNVWKKYYISDKNIKLEIAGMHSGDFMSMQGGNVKVYGYVQNLDKLIASWDACVVPVRYGTGRQNKILSAWINKVPVVASPFAASSVGGTDGKNLLVASSVEEYYFKTEILRKNKNTGKKLALAGAGFVKKHYDWGRSCAIIDREVKKLKFGRNK